MSTRRERIAAIVERIGMTIGARTAYPGDVVRSALTEREQQDATAALLSAAVLRPDDGEERPLPPIPKPGAQIRVLLLTGEDDEHRDSIWLDVFYLDSWRAGLWYVPVDDDVPAQWAPWSDVLSMEGPR